MILPKAVSLFRFLFSYASAMGTMPRREAREEQACINVKFASTVLIAAAIIVAVRLAREDISQPNPRVVSSIGQGVGLARMILNEVLRRFPGASERYDPRFELSGFEADCSSRTDREGGDYAGSRATAHPRRQDGRHGDIRRSAFHGGRDTTSTSRALADQVLLGLYRGSQVGACDCT